MCYGCYEDAGKPEIVNEKTIKASELIKELYDTEFGGVGRYGHIVFDDWNIDDDNIEWCIENANKGGYWQDENDEEGAEETRQASLTALIYFKELSEEERYSALAIDDGFLKIK